MSETETIDTAPPEPAVPKRRRGPGRPPKNAPDAPEAANAAGEGGAPAGEAAEAGEAREAPKRRKRGAADPDIGLLAQQVMGAHHALAMVMQMPEMAISDKEALALTSASINLLREYDIVIDSKVAAALAFAGALLGVYVPRLAHAARRMAQQRARGAGPVVQGVAEAPPAGTGLN